MCVSDMNILKTRALEHSRDVRSRNADNKTKKATRKKVESVIKCCEHHKADASKVWSAANSNCDKGFKYTMLHDVKHGCLTTGCCCKLGPDQKS